MLQDLQRNRIESIQAENYSGGRRTQEQMARRIQTTTFLSHSMTTSSKALEPWYQMTTSSTQNVAY